MVQDNRKATKRNFDKGKILGNRGYYYDAEIGEIPESTDQIRKTSEDAEKEAEKFLQKYDNNGFKSI